MKREELSEEKVGIRMPLLSCQYSSTGDVVRVRVRLRHNTPKRVICALKRHPDFENMRLGDDEYYIFKYKHTGEEL